MMNDKPEGKSIEFDAEAANEYLDILARTKDSTALLPLNQAASINLAVMSADVQYQMEQRAEEIRAESEAQAAQDRKKVKEPEYVRE